MCDGFGGEDEFIHIFELKYYQPKSKKTMPNPTPLAAFHFSVQWGGTKIGFTEVSGLDVETQIIEYRHGASPEYSTIKMPGLQKYNNLILKRGVMQKDNEFYNWWNTTKLLNRAERRDITISLLNEDHEPVVVWRVRNAFPVKVNGGEYNSTKNEVSIETLEIAHEGITVQND